MKTPARYNMLLRKGNDCNQLFTFQQSSGDAMDLTDFTIKSQIRASKARDSTLIVEFTVTTPDPTDGKVYLSLTDTQIDTITVGKGYYDILLTTSVGFDETYVEGIVSIQETVTSKE